MFNYELMKSMKIIDTNEDEQEFIANVIKKLKALEICKDTSSEIYLNNIERLILENKIVLGSPILKNLLLDTEPVSSCTIIPVNLRKDLDNIKSILEPYAITTMGSGYDLNQVDDPCKAIEKISEAIHELIQVYPNRLSAMGTLDVSSPHILNFINLKKKRDYSTCHYNISVKIPDDFLKGIKEYEVLNNGKTIKITNKEILEEISKSIHCCGEPGIIFINRFNETNPLQQKEYEYKSVAPCAEIAMSEGEVCQFSYLNLAKFVDLNGKIDKKELMISVQVLTRMLDNLCDVSIKNAKYKSNIIEDKRRIGVGVCGYADMLAKLCLPYGSDESKKITENLFTFINFYSKVESVKLAKERGCFRKYNESLCKKREWYDRFRINGKEWITDLEWEAFFEGLRKYGIRNSSTTAVPPTGRSASIVNASYSIEPYFTLYDYNTKTGLNQILADHIEKGSYLRKEKDEIIKKILETGSCYGLDNKYNDIKEIFKTGNEIEPIEHIDMISIINNCIDESISKTVNVKNKTTSSEIYKYIMESHKKGLNGITFFRDKCLEERQIDEMER